MRLKQLILVAAMIALPVTATQWQAKRTVQPLYPVNAIKANIEGCVSMQFFISPQGKPIFIETIDSFPQGVFDKAAHKAMQQWRYQPINSELTTTAQRESISLGFALSPHSEDASRCSAKMTNESEHLDTFKQQRLTDAIEVTSLATLAAAIKRISVVLDKAQAKELDLLHAALLSKIKNNEQHNLISDINGLNYVDLIKSNRQLIKQSSTVTQSHITQAPKAITIEKLPLRAFEDVINNWDFSYASIGMSASLFSHLSQDLLEVELQVNTEGEASLIGTCRELRPEVLKALIYAIENWQLEPLSQQPQAARFLFTVPAPTSIGAQYLCDQQWHPERTKARL